MAQVSEKEKEFLSKVLKNIDTKIKEAEDASNTFLEKMQVTIEKKQNIC